MTEAVSIFIILAMLVAVGLGATAEASPPEDVPRMTKEQVKSMMGNSEFVIIDVRAPNDWNGTGSKIKRAIREDPSNVPAWVNKYPKEKTLLFYCA